MPPPAKSLSEISACMLQFRSVLRISNVGVKEFLDLIVFKDNKTSIKFTDFKLRIGEIMKNYTQDFAWYLFDGQPILNRDQLEEMLSKKEIYFELNESMEQKLEIEFKKWKIALKESFDIEDTKSVGFVTLKQYEEVLENLELNLEKSKPPIL